MRAGALLTVAALSAASAPGDARAETQNLNTQLVPGQGIFLLVNSSKDAITVLKVAPARKPAAPRRPSLPLKGWERHPIGTEELVVSMHDKKGKLLGTYGFPTRRVAFHDGILKKDQALQGSTRGLTSVDLPVQLPNLTNAESLYFWRVVIGARSAIQPAPAPRRGWRIDGQGPYGSVALAVEPMGAYLLADRPRVAKKLPVRKIFRRLKVPLTVIADPDLLSLLIGLGPNLHITWSCPDGTYESENLGAGTDPATSFNVVILGDGYTSTQMTTFQTDAARVKEALLSNRPFSEFASQINVYRIETPSTDSGVDHCPHDCGYCPCPGVAADPKTTALEVFGDASGLGFCTEFDAYSLDLYQAGCSVLGPGDVDLFIVLVNCDVYGGITYPSTRTIFAASGSAADIIAHEAGHALAAIGEEYLGGVLPCLDASCSSGCAAPVEFVNVALPADVASGAVSWLPLATHDEAPAGKLKTVEEQSGGDCHDSPGPHEGEAQTLGLYWGAQYLADEPDTISWCDACPSCRVTVGGQCVTLCVDPLCDPRGASFYRPMPYCKMRSLEEPYCRVCYCALRNVLVGETGLTPSTSWCP